ncbi:hypothetical protein SB719_22955, partial [Pantoea sp. SIMBA_079]|uniref:hypothetical protein n=1 Tax=Pantoea sp. SIMBA_079 TaxID=3085817 RepID=UPI003993A032
GWTPRRLVDNFDAEWGLIGSRGSTLYLATTRDAERRRIVGIDVADTDARFIDVVGEQAHTLNDAALLGDRLLVAYL